jgi:chemotaxis protein MotB
MKISASIYVITGLLLASCGPSKKLQNANSQINLLNGQVETLSKQVAADQKNIDQLKTENIAYSKEAEQCRQVKEAINQRLDNFNKALAEHGTSMEELKAKAAKALQDFNDVGCTVTYKYGLIHVIMPETLIFEKNSTKISGMGKQAISVVADVMTDYKGMRAIIVGNSDSTVVTGSGSKFKDNWELSTERSLSVIRVLRDKFNIDPTRLTAAGRSKYDPIADNATEEGRAMNRRIEVILDPEYKRIWEMSENK